MLGQEGSEQHRIRVGFVFLVLGLLLLFWAWGSWIYRSSVPAQAQALVRAHGTGIDGTAGPQRGIEDRAKLVRAVWLFLSVGLGLVLIVLFGTYALVRAARRYRVQADKEREDTSETPDAWGLHVPPDDQEIGPRPSQPGD